MEKFSTLKVELKKIVHEATQNIWKKYYQNCKNIEHVWYVNPMKLHVLWKTHENWTEMKPIEWHVPL